MNQTLEAKDTLIKKKQIGKRVNSLKYKVIGVWATTANTIILQGTVFRPLWCLYPGINFAVHNESVIQRNSKAC